MDRVPELSSSRAKVLVVDDDDAIRAVLCKLLRGHDYRVLGAQHGRDALDQLDGGAPRPDLILLDLDMPVMGGPAFLVELAQRPTLREVPVVVLSAAPDNRARVHGFDVAAVLDKPVPITELIDLLDGLLGRRSTTS